MAAFNMMCSGRVLIREMLAVVFAVAGLCGTASAADPAGRIVIASHVTMPPAWFDPSTAPAQITPFAILYAVHEALVRPYPGQRVGPSL